MIHLDTNYLIMALAPGTSEDTELRAWLADGRTIGVSAVAWGEFLCGPATPAQVATASNLLSNPEPFTATDAARAAELFNHAGRRRGSFLDCMIAAVALRVEASLATANVADFRRFEEVGLRLIG